MQLNRPIVFFDLEATGADPLRDRIVEIAMIKMMPDGALEEVDFRINPGIRIPAEATAIHGIRNEDVANAPSFSRLADTILEFLDGADLGGFGLSRFDIPMLTEEFRRANRPFALEGRGVIDGLTIFHQRERRDLTAAYQFYCQKTLIGAHGAKADARASLEVVLAQIKHYEDLPRDIEALHRYCNKQDDRFVDSTRKFMWRDGEAVINFGKYKGQPLRILATEQRDYIQWMVGDGKFAQDVIDICYRALRGEFPVQEKKVQNHVA